MGTQQTIGRPPSSGDANDAASQPVLDTVAGRLDPAPAGTATNTVLVMEPDERMARLLTVALTGHGLGVECVDHPGSVEVALTATNYSLIVLDLPSGVEGESVLYGVMAIRPGLRVIVISSNEDKEFVVRCFNAGVVDYVGKPFHLIEFVARVEARLRTALAAAPAGHSRRAEPCPLTLDVLRRTADTGSGAVRLTSREFVLLDYLVQHAGRVVGREELMRAWGRPFEPESNLVENYVSRLRLKLGEDLVDTIHRTGYRFAGTPWSAAETPGAAGPTPPFAAPATVREAGG